MKKLLERTLYVAMALVALSGAIEIAAVYLTVLGVSVPMLLVIVAYWVLIGASAVAFSIAVINIWTM